MQKRIGFYCWAGPDMIKMTKLKYFSPVIDTKSLMHSYDLDYLKEVKDKLGITDIWATFSWGFGIENEQEQYKFLLSKLPEMHDLGLKVHAYIQGPNMAISHTPSPLRRGMKREVDIWAKNNFNKDIVYHRGRQVTCINNPEFLKLQNEIIDLALDYDFDGVFIDNIWMGQMPIELGNNMTFFGCKCKYCKEKYSNQIKSFYFDYSHNKHFESYKNFRVNCVTEYLKNIYEKVHAKNKEFGWNSYTGLDSEIISGIDLNKVKTYCDYILIENHSLPGFRDDDIFSNKYLEEFIKEIEKPVFVVSYKEGIGQEEQYNEEDISNIFHESEILHYSPCFKGSEYLTHNTWHNLKIEKIKKELLKKDYLNMHNFLNTDTDYPEFSLHKSNSKHTPNHLRRSILKTLALTRAYIQLQGINFAFYRFTKLVAGSRRTRNFFLKRGFYKRIYAKQGV